MSASCYRCQKETSLAEGKISFSDECPHCFSDLHCCKMCGFFDSAVYNSCTEPSADRIVEKEKKNFCDFFVLTGNQQAGDSSSNALSAAEALFKK